MESNCDAAGPDVYAELAILRRRLERERKIRLEAETIAEENLRGLYTKQQQLELLQSVSTAANVAGDVTEALRAALPLICNFIDWPLAHVYLWHPVSRTLLPGLLWHLTVPDGFAAFRASTEMTTFKPGIGLPGRVFLSRRPAWIRDLSLDGNFPRASVAAESGLRSGFAFPILHGEEVVAILEFYDNRVHDPDIALLEISTHVATQLSRVVERDRARELRQFQMESLSHMHFELTVAYDATIEGWSRALDLRDRETEGHSRRVTEMTHLLAEAVGYDPNGFVALRRGALLHDIGKMGIPDLILLKPGPLTDEEWVIMKKHPQYAYDMLAPIAFLGEALEIPLCHHEKWDGSGYPRGLKGTDIPLSARIFAIVDVWDALSSDRPYRLAWEFERVVNHIRSLSGSHFDPAVVDAFLHLLGKSDLPKRQRRAA